VINIGNFLFFLLFILVGSYIFLGFKLGTIVVIIYLFAALIMYIINIYNKLKSEQIKITESKSNIGVYLQQRYDEITAMYKIVQEYKLHELETFKEIVQLRQLTKNEQLSFKEKTQIHNSIEEKLPSIMATFENYPELRSNENFLQLQTAIQDNEDNISSSRKSYNGYVNRYNTSISMFPVFIFARVLNFNKEELYEAPTNKIENPLL
jgi:LemA protein